MKYVKKVLVAIPNYNGKHLLEKHLDSVCNTEYDLFDIVVVDNGSTDGSVNFVKEKYPNIKVIEIGENVGFGRANNIAVKKYPNYEFYVFVNNDISVEKNWLKEMLLVIEGAGAVGPKILYSKKIENKYVINSAGMEIDNHYFGYDRYEGESDDEKFNIIENVDALTGAVLLVPKRVWDEVGGFNEKFFLYYEDVDICLRIRDLGYSIKYCGRSTAYHDHMGSSKNLGSFKRNLMSMRNRYISIVSREGFLIGLTETVWYIFNWGIWKLLFSKRCTLKEFFREENEKKRY